MADLATVERALVKADAAGDAAGARVLAGEVRRLRGGGGATATEERPVPPDTGPAFRAAPERNRLQRTLDAVKTSLMQTEGAGIEPRFRKAVEAAMQGSGIGPALTEAEPGAILPPAYQAATAPVEAPFMIGSAALGGAIQPGTVRERAGRAIRGAGVEAARQAREVVGGIPSELLPESSEMVRRETVPSDIKTPSVAEVLERYVPAYVAIPIEIASVGGTGALLTKGGRRILAAFKESVAARKVGKEAALLAETDKKLAKAFEDATETERVEFLRQAEDTLKQGDVPYDVGTPAQEALVEAGQIAPGTGVLPSEEAARQASIRAAERSGIAKEAKVPAKPFAGDEGLARTIEDAPVAPAEVGKPVVPPLILEGGEEAAAAHGRVAEKFGTRIGARGKPVEGLGSNAANLNWDAIGNDLVAATRHIAAKSKEYLAYAMEVVKLYGEKVKPFLEKAWRAIKAIHADEAGEFRIGQAARDAKEALASKIKAKGAGAAGYRPTLPASTREFMGQLQSRAFAMSSQMRTTLEDAAKGLSTQEKDWLHENFYDTFRSGGSAPAKMPNAQKYLDAWRSVSEPTPGAYKAAGREIGTIEHYVPQVWTDEFRNAMARQKGDLYEAWLDDVRRMNPDISAEQIQEISDKIAKEVKRGAGRGESYTKGRFFKNMPSEVTVGGKPVSILEKDPFKLARNYSENVGRNLTKQQVAFEKGYKTFADLEADMRSAIRREHGEGVSGTFSDQMRTIHGEGFTGGLESAYKKIAPIGNIAKGLKLTATSIPNVVMGYVPLIAKAGPKQFAKTVARTFSRMAAEGAGGILSKVGAKQASESVLRIGAKTGGQIEFGRRAGSWAERYLEDMAGGITGEGVASTLARAPVKWTAGEAANRGINKVASVLADDMLKSGDELLVRRIGETAYFSEARIQKILKGVIDDADRAQAMQYLAAKTNNSLEFATEVSRFYQNPIVRDGLMFSGITRTLGNATLDAITAARKGDVRQLATLLGLGIPAAYGTQEIRQWLNGRDRYSKMDNGERLFEAILQTGLLGMLGYHADSVKYAVGAKGPQDFMENLWVQYMPPAMDLIGVPIEMFRRGNAKPARAASPIADIIAVQFFGEKPLGYKPRPGSREAKEKSLERMRKQREKERAQRR